MQFIQGTIRGFGLVCLCGALGACGEDLPQQAVLGGAAGALGAVVVDGDPVAGAAIGAAGNALYCQTYPTRCR